MYENDANDATEALTSDSRTGLSEDTINRILALSTRDNNTVRFDPVAPDSEGNVTVPAGAEVVLVSSSDTFQTTIKPPANAPVIIFQGKGGVDVTFESPSSGGVSDRVVVGSVGNDRIVIADDTKSTIITYGDDNVILGSGSSTVIGGIGNSSVTGGSGDSIVQLGGSATDYTVTISNGHAIVTDNSTQNTTDISKIQYVQLDSGKALVFANDTAEAAVSTLYHSLFGRDADAGGLYYWFDIYRAGASLKQIADAFMNSTEYLALGTQSDDAFVNSLYLQTFGRQAEDEGLEYWVSALQTGGATRADLANSFSQIAANSIGNIDNTEATVVGSVTIVHNII